MELPVDLDSMSTEVDGPTVRARRYPIPVDAAALEVLASSPGVLEHERRLAERRREHLVLRVDRADLSKTSCPGRDAR
ncbi:MAG: hypothetical protein ACRD0S_12100 [Acidimicrobiales bacterium]